MNSATAVVPQLRNEDEASKFLRLLDPGSISWNFRTFDDNKSRQSRNLAYATKVPGSLAASYVTLKAKNSAGAGVFVVVNEGGQIAASITRVRAVFLDLDGAPIEAVQQCELVPHVAVESSPGRFHAYWKTDDLSPEDFADLQRSIAKRFGGDTTVNDLSRVMRLPGFLHQKATPFASRIVHAYDAAPYPADAIRREFTRPARLVVSDAAPTAPVTAPTAIPSPTPQPMPVAPPAPAGAVLVQPFAVGDPNPLDVRALRSALADLDAHDSATWRHVMTALRSLGDAGYAELNAWSATAPQAYNPASNRRLWDVATPLDGGVRVVYAMAAAKGWINPASNLARDMRAPFLPMIPNSRASLSFKRIGLIEPQPVDWLIEGWIVADTVAGMIGASGAGKSFVAMTIAACVATGKPFFGLESAQGPVFYLAGEGSIGLAARGQAWEVVNRANLGDAPLFISSGLPALTDPAGVETVIAAIRESVAHYGSPKLIVVDTLNRSFGGEDENSASAMGKFITGIDRIRHELNGATVLIVHHVSNDTSRARGSSAFYASLDSCALVARSPNGAIELCSTKEKDWSKPTPMILELVEQEVFSGDTSCVLQSPGATYANATKELTVIEVISAVNIDGSYRYSGRQAVDLLKERGIKIDQSTVARKRAKLKSGATQ